VSMSKTGIVVINSVKFEALLAWRRVPLGGVTAVIVERRGRVAALFQAIALPLDLSFRSAFPDSAFVDSVRCVSALVSAIMGSVCVIALSCLVSVSSICLGVGWGLCMGEDNCFFEEICGVEWAEILGGDLESGEDSSVSVITCGRLLLGSAKDSNGGGRGGLATD
jgi:hypothetical protein